MVDYSSVLALADYIVKSLISGNDIPSRCIEMYCNGKSVSIIADEVKLTKNQVRGYITRAREKGFKLGADCRIVLRIIDCARRIVKPVVVLERVVDSVPIYRCTVCGATIYSGIQYVIIHTAHAHRELIYRYIYDVVKCVYNGIRG